MERQFGLPIAFAAALHGAVLFGTNSSPRPVAVAKQPETHLVPFTLQPPPEEPVVVTSGEESSAPKSPPDTPVPTTQPEPPTVEIVSDFKISPPPVQPVDASDLRKVPLMPSGVRDGTGNNPWSDGIISSALLDNSPRTRFQAAPVYPFAAKREGLSGEVHIEFLVDETGAVLEPRVVHATNRIFEEASLRAVAKWKFEPGRRGGKIVRFRMVVPVVFNLND